MRRWKGDSRFDKGIFYAVCALVVLGLIALLFIRDSGDDESALDAVESTTTTSTTIVPAGSTSSVPSSTTTAVAVPGFKSVKVTVTDSDGSHGAFCMLHAKNAEQRAEGMMNKRGFFGYDGMVFSFREPTRAEFWGKNVDIPLSVAWFTEDGIFINAENISPCHAKDGNCPTVAADATYKYAIETPQGQLGSVGIGNGANISVGGSCS